MANVIQLARLMASSVEKNGCAAWNRWWRDGQRHTLIDLRGADLNGAYLMHNILRDADLRGAQLRGADLTGADLRDAILRDADLSRANLSFVDLMGADLNGANLSNVDLSNAVLSGANLRGAVLRGANLTGADLRDANLSGAHFISADLSSANLHGSILIGVDFTGANLTDARMHSTNLGNLDLRGVVGLTSANHQGPSNLATNTLYASHGEIPDVFLRGCGLPDEMIGFVHAIAGAIQYYSAFISYNHEDDVFATRLYNDLQANNVRCWKYTEDVKIGDEIERAVDQAIRLHDKLLVIFSAQSVASDWVADEVERAMKREEQEQKSILFPVMIDDAINQVDYGWAKHVRRDLNIGDFTGWKDQDQYQPRFDHLLRDLKAD